MGYGPGSYKGVVIEGPLIGQIVERPSNYFEVPCLGGCAEPLPTTTRPLRSKRNVYGYIYVPMYGFRGVWIDVKSNAKRSATKEEPIVYALDKLFRVYEEYYVAREAYVKE